MVGLIVRDMGDAGQGCVDIKEAPRHAAQAGGRDAGGKVAQLVGLQRGVAATQKDQVALQRPARNGASAQDAGGKAVGGAEFFKGEKRGDRLGDRSGRQWRIGLTAFDQGAGGGIGKGIGDSAAQLCGGDQRLGIGSIGAGAATARHGPGRGVHHLGQRGRGDRGHQASQKETACLHRILGADLSPFTPGRHQREGRAQPKQAAPCQECQPAQNSAIWYTAGSPRISMKGKVTPSEEVR